jgi:hypothetical protein
VPLLGFHPSTSSVFGAALRIYENVSAKRGFRRRCHVSRGGRARAVLGVIHSPPDRHNRAAPSHCCAIIHRQKKNGWRTGRPSLDRNSSGRYSGRPTMEPAHLCAVIGRCHSEGEERGHASPDDSRLGVLCILSEESSSSEFSSGQRCECTTGRRSTRVVRDRNYGIRIAYLIGYDPLPYRFGSTFVWEPPYRYYRH